MSQFSPYGGGGGFMQGSPGGSQGSLSGGGGKSPASQSVRPVTIAQVRKASQMHSDAEWMVDDHAIGQVTIVAELQENRVFSTNRTFFIDDGTGRIEAKMWMDTQDTQKPHAWRGIAPGKSPDTEMMYVRVTGSIKTHNDKRHIHASNIRLVKDPNEIYFHLLEVISTNVVLQKGLPSQSGHEQQTGAVQGQSAYTVQSRPTNSGGLFSEMADKVVRYLSSLPPNPQGTYVGDIAKAMKTDSMELSDTVDKLIDDGHVFTTIDDSHIQLAT
ncbi:replication protein A subunit RPA32 [Mycena maculata]|uniref:Replication protein A subunit RPA32 n=1 Tax=Mycena maculata TaxID=230809 RepID=A0AAD7NTY9_9AGAR|nr:replication protein A subunit RPA32 [Mycena maculata]